MIIMTNHDSNHIPIRSNDNTNHNNNSDNSNTNNNNNTTLIIVMIHSDHRIIMNHRYIYIYIYIIIYIYIFISICFKPEVRLNHKTTEHLTSCTTLGDRWMPNGWPEAKSAMVMAWGLRYGYSPDSGHP